MLTDNSVNVLAIEADPGALVAFGNGDMPGFNPESYSLSWSDSLSGLAAMIGEVLEGINLGLTVNNAISSFQEWRSKPDQYKATKFAGNLTKLAVLTGNAKTTYHAVDFYEKSLNAGFALKDGNNAYALDNVLGAVNKVFDYMSFTAATAVTTKAVIGVGGTAFTPAVGPALILGKIGYDWYSRDTALEDNFLYQGYQQDIKNGDMSFYDYAKSNSYISSLMSWFNNPADDAILLNEGSVTVDYQENPLEQGVNKRGITDYEENSQINDVNEIIILE